MKNKIEDRKIVFVNQGANYLTIDIINAFEENFEKVSFITGNVREQDVTLIPNIQITRILKYNKKNLLTKIFTWFIATIQIYFLLLFKYRKHEIFFISIPPNAYLLSILLPNRCSMLIWDVYPDILRIYNFGKYNPLFFSWAYLNKIVFKRAYRIFTIGNRMAGMLSKYAPKEKINVIPLWSGLTKAKPIPKNQNHFAVKHNVVRKFVVQYSGNIGHTHNVEVLVELAERFRENEDIVFMIIGRGQRARTIERKIQEKNLKNCIMLPFQDDEMVPYSLGAADLGFVVLDDKVGQGSIPSKTYNLMAVGAPVMCIASKESELNDYIEAYDNGRCFSKDELDNMAYFIEELRSSPEELRRLKRNSISASKDFTRKNAYMFVNKYLE